MLKPLRKLTVICLIVAYLLAIASCSGYSHEQVIESEPGLLTATFIDVGQGDSILIETPSGKTMLVDGGERTAGDKVVEVLRERGIQRIDVVVATHPHADHIGGLITVLQRLPVDIVYDSAKPHSSKTYEDYLRLIYDKDISFRSARAGDEIVLDDSVKISVLWPPRTDAGDPFHIENLSVNNASVVLYISFGDTTLLLTGDIEALVEEEMIRKGSAPEAQVLKVAHHGSSTSSSSDFISMVRPEIAVICAARDNIYGFPHWETVRLLIYMGCKILMTETHGTFALQSDGKTWTVNP